MAGMQRFVTYLYSYEGNEKLHNTGFAKVEIRGGQCRMEIHLKGAAPAGGASSIYLFSRDHDVIHAVEIGKMKFAGGSGDYRGVFSSNEIGGSPYNILDMKGIFIPIDATHMFASQWDETEIDQSRIKIWEPAGEAKQEGNIQERREPEDIQEKAEAPGGIRENAVTGAAKGTREKAAMGQPEEVQREAESTQTATAGQPGNVQETADSAGQEMPQETEDTAEQDVSVSATAIPLRAPDLTVVPQETLLDAFLRLQKGKQNVEVFETGKRQVSGIHIELRDIRELPKQHWNMGNNSFLLHGFFNYRYLLLGKKNERGKETIFIGVPGVYHNQERIMAALFGFPEFLPDRPAQTEGESKEIFGYWCHSIVG